MCDHHRRWWFVGIICRHYFDTYCHLYVLLASRATSNLPVKRLPIPNPTQTQYTPRPLTCQLIRWNCKPLSRLSVPQTITSQTHTVSVRVVKLSQSGFCLNNSVSCREFVLCICQCLLCWISQKLASRMQFSTNKRATWHSESHGSRRSVMDGDTSEEVFRRATQRASTSTNFSVSIPSWTACWLTMTGWLTDWMTATRDNTKCVSTDWCDIVVLHFIFGLQSLEHLMMITFNYFGVRPQTPKQLLFLRPRPHSNQ